MRPCLAAICQHELDFVKRFRLGVKTHEALIPNGVDLSRIKEHFPTNNAVPTFLAFGGRNADKRIDILLSAAKIVSEKGLKFKIILTLGTDTLYIAQDIFGNNIPNWLELVSQVGDINNLFEISDCFISSSIHESFSYAIAESLVAGLPVIMSDIEGTSWAKDYPGVMTFRSLDATDLASCLEIKINELINSKARLTDRTLALNNLSLDNWTERITEFFIAVSQQPAMNLQNGRILFAAQYAAPYTGNFIPSLKALEQRLNEQFGAKCGYIFPKDILNHNWGKVFTEKNRVYLTGDGKHLITKKEADAILHDFQPTLIHTHFEGYDLAIHRAVKRSHRPIIQVWHMHDSLSFHKNPLKAAYQLWCYFKHYGLSMIVNNNAKF